MARNRRIFFSIVIAAALAARSLGTAESLRAQTAGTSMVRVGSVGATAGTLSRPLEPPHRPVLGTAGKNAISFPNVEVPTLAQSAAPVPDAVPTQDPTSPNPTSLNPTLREMPDPENPMQPAISSDSTRTPLPPDPFSGDTSAEPSPSPGISELPPNASPSSPDMAPNGPPADGRGPDRRRGAPPVQVVVVPQNAAVESAESSDAKKEENTDEALLDAQMRSPRLTFDFFLKSAAHNSYDQAIHAIDFSDRPGMTDKEKKALAYNLYSVINRLSEPDIKSIPNDESLRDYAYQPNKNFEPLVLIKKDGKFLFSPETVEKIDEMFERLRDLRPAVFKRIPYLCNLSDSWFKTDFGLRRIQWLALAVVAVVGYLLGLFVSKILYYLTMTSFHLLSTDLSEYNISKKTWRPIGWLLMYTFWYLGILAAQVPPKVVETMGCPIQTLAVVMFVVTGMRLIDIFSLWMRKKVGSTKSKVNEILNPLLRRSSKIILVAVGVVMIFQAFGFSAVGIVSGMGIGGIAIALAAQNTIANLFGSITVLVDRPFIIGDWIVTSSVEGEVETVGLRSTRIRTFYNSLVTVPNNLLTTAIIDNMGRRHFRRYKTSLGVQYDTPPDRIEAFCEGIRELILSYNFTRKDVFHVYANEFSALSSIDILLVCFFLVPDTAAEYKARSTLILDIMRLAEEMDVRFAFPSRTIYNIAADEKDYEEPLLSNDEFGKASAAGIIERRVAAEKTRNAGAFGEQVPDRIAAVGELADTLSRKKDEVLKKRRFFRKAG